MKVDAAIISRDAVVHDVDGFDNVLVERGNNPAMQRNRCIARSTADVIVFLDDDATPIEGYASAVRRIMSDPFVAGCGGPSIPSVTATPMQCMLHRVLATASSDTWLRYTVAHEQYASWRAFAGCSFAFRRSCGELFDEHFKYASGEDMDFQRRVFSHGSLVYSPALAVYHNPHSLFAQLRSIYRWGRDNQGGQSGSAISALFPALWTVFAFAYGFGLVAGKTRKGKS